MPLIRVLLAPTVSSQTTEDIQRNRGSNAAAAISSLHVHSLAGCVQQLAQLSTYASELFAGGLCLCVLLQMRVGRC
jgi:hypothetical protein